MSSLAQLSVEQKVGQLLMVAFSNDELEKMFRDTYIGSVILYTRNSGTPEEVKSLCTRIQKLSQEHTGMSCIIAIDQEGGSVTRLRGKGYTEFPTNLSVGQTKDKRLANLIGRAMGVELRALGITWNMAPVCDVNTNPLNPVIGVRSFGGEAQLVTEFALEEIEGFHWAQIGTTIKHYPGHGNTKKDSHFDLPTVDKDLSSLESELMPFLSLAKHTDAIMTAHILLPKLDATACATLSAPILGHLRTAGYEGLIISDSLTMAGLLKSLPGGDIGNAAIQALAAGCDILCLGGTVTPDVRKVHQAIVRAVNEGVLSMQKIEESLARVYKAKSRFSLPDFTLVPNLEDHFALVREIAQKAFTVIRTPKPFSLKDKKIFVFYSSMVKSVLDRTTLFSNLQIVGFTTEKELRVTEYAKGADYCLWILCNAFKDESLQNHLSSLVQNSSVQTALVTVGGPYDSDYFVSYNQITFIANTYSPTSAALQVAVEILTS